MSAHTLAARAGCEMLGSLMTYVIAVGGVANALLPRTKGEGMGLLGVATTVGFGVGLPIALFHEVSCLDSRGSVSKSFEIVHATQRQLPRRCRPACCACCRSVPISTQVRLLYKQ